MPKDKPRKPHKPSLNHKPPKGAAESVWKKLQEKIAELKDVPFKE